MRAERIFTMNIGAPNQMLMPNATQKVVEGLPSNAMFLSVRPRVVARLGRNP